MKIIHSHAIIGTQFMHAGDKIGEASIVKIEKNSVTFEWKGQTKTLTVGQSWNSQRTRCNNKEIMKFILKGKIKMNRKECIRLVLSIIIVLI